MTAQPPHNNRPDKPEGIKNMRKYLGLPENDPDNQADWLTEALETIKIGVELQLHQLPRLTFNITEAKAAITTKIAEERQSAKIELIDMLITTKTHLSSVKMMELSAELEAGLKRED